MSLGLQLASLERERVILLGQKQKHDISLSLSTSTSRDNSNLGKQIKTNDISREIYRMKEYTLINHIESLKAAACGEILASNPNEISNSNSIKGREYNNTPSCLSNIHQDGRSLCSSSTNWIIDPGSVEGNLRVNSNSRKSSSQLEDVASRGSSCAKQSTTSGEDDNKRISNSRKRSAKGTKKKAGKKKEGRLTIQERRDSKNIPSPSTSSNFKKSADVSNGLPSSDLSVLTALCKRIQIHEKTPLSSISIKEAPYPKKSSPSINLHRKSSPARTSLSNAMVEYTKRLPPALVQKKKNNCSVDDISRTKVFLSEKQSGVLSDCGKSYPCAPPATPTTDQLKRIEYVPSLQDIRSQRSIRQRLQILESKAVKKEKRIQEDADRIEKMSLKEKRIEKKKKQRQEIYALNQLMTDWEHQRFVQFMSQAGPNI